MRNKLALAAVIGLGLTAGAPAWAETTTANPTAQPPANGTMSTPMLQQKIQSDLQKAGFKNIKVAPQAFAVHAVNSDNQPVFMLISPDSVTAITAENSGKSSATSNGQSSKM